MRGKVRDRPFLKWRSWDHPRLCGEKAGGWETLIDEKGSPPPMRGKDANCKRNAW